MSRIATMAAIALLATTACACGDANPEICARPETEEPTPYRKSAPPVGGGGAGGMAAQGGGGSSGGVAIYSSAAPDGELLYWPGGAHYRIFHELGAVPTSFDFYLSFDRYGLGDGSLAQAAGNQVEVKALDEESITIVNGTCAEFYLLAVIRAEN